VRILTDAVQAGKDAYLRKARHPLRLKRANRFIAAVRESKRIVQIGLQQRSWEHFAQARDEIANGTLGQVTFIRTYWYQKSPHRRQGREFRRHQTRLEAFPRPRLRPSVSMPINTPNWRWYWDFGSGAMTGPLRSLGGRGPLIMGVDTPSRATANGFTAVLAQRQTPDTMSRRAGIPGPRHGGVRLRAAGYIEGGGLMIRGNQGSHAAVARRIFRLPGISANTARNPQPSEPIMQVKSQIDGTVSHVKNFVECLRSRKSP